MSRAQRSPKAFPLGQFQDLVRKQCVFETLLGFGDSGLGELSRLERQFPLPGSVAILKGALCAIATVESGLRRSIRTPDVATQVRHATQNRAMGSAF